MGLVIWLWTALRSNEAILDFPLSNDNLLTVKGLDIEHASVPIWSLGWDYSLATLIYFLRSNGAILDFLFPGDNSSTI